MWRNVETRGEHGSGRVRFGPNLPPDPNKSGPPNSHPTPTVYNAISDRDFFLGHKWVGSGWTDFVILASSLKRGRIHTKNLIN